MLVDGAKPIKIKVNILEKKAEPGKAVVPPNFYVPNTSLVTLVEQQRYKAMH